MAALLNTSVMLPLSPAYTTAAAPVVVLLPVEVDSPLLAGFSKPVLVTVAVSPGRPFTQVLLSTSVAWRRVLVWVQVMAVSVGAMVSVTPASGVSLPVHAKVAS
ncbi:hypothetical protein D9M72_542830 [compost metagenome]